MTRVCGGARALRVLAAAALLVVCAAADLAAEAAAESDPTTALKIGLLMDFSSGSADVLTDRQRAFELAIEHINAAGGVFGRPVATAVGDTTADAERRLHKLAAWSNSRAGTRSSVPTPAPMRWQLPNG